VTRNEAEEQIMAHLKEIVKIAQAYDADTNYITLTGFVEHGYLSLTNGKAGDHRLNCHYMNYKKGELISD